MPKINKKIKIENCDTLQIYQYDNSKNWFVKFYVGLHYSKSGMYDKTLQLKNQKDAVKKAKELWRSFNFSEKKKSVEYDFVKDIAEPFFKLRRKQYENKGKVKYADKEKNQYKNKILPIFKDLDYRNN